MDIFSAYDTINKSVLNVIHSLNTLHPVVEDKKQDFIRLEERPFVLTSDIFTTCGVVTAHNLNQYKNEFHNLRIKEDVTCWLDELLEIDSMEGCL